ncbi:hypothetical protein ABIA00_005758 [Bradyrhizobium ottawaense]
MRTAKSRGPSCRCYSQALRRCAKPDRAKRIANPRGDGGKQELVSGESAPYAVRPSRREGRTFRLHLLIRCALRVHLIARRTVGASRRPAFPAPFRYEGVTRSAKLGRKRREDAKVCLLNKGLAPRTQRSGPAMRSIVRGGALQSRGPSCRVPCGSWVPARRHVACAMPRRPGHGGLRHEGESASPYPAPARFFCQTRCTAQEQPGGCEARSFDVSSFAAVAAKALSLSSRDGM